MNAGHDLTRDNVSAIAQIEGIYKLNINHAFIAGAVLVGLEQAVIMMKEAMYIDL
ncbi:pyridoxine 5'-phosphate synthase [Psychrobacter immobilis]|uniref:pyridoxine 5'-phosphate synthase n=1 Tax=Psychrobacter TaxID=497 RepID=UPI003879A4F5